MRHYAAASKMQEYAAIFFRAQIYRGSSAPELAPISHAGSRSGADIAALHAGFAAKVANSPRRAAPAPICGEPPLFFARTARCHRAALTASVGAQAAQLLGAPSRLFAPRRLHPGRAPSCACGARARWSAGRMFLAAVSYGLRLFAPARSSHGACSFCATMQATSRSSFSRPRILARQRPNPRPPVGLLVHRPGAPRFSVPLPVLAGSACRLVCGGFHSWRLVVRPGASGSGGMATARMGRGATGFAVPVAFAVPVVCAVPAGSAVPVAPTIPARMAIAAPVVGAAPIGASPPALHSGAPSGGASGGAGSPPRCGAPPPVGAFRGFCSFGAFCLLVAAGLQAKKGRALCGDASSVTPLDRSAVPPAGLPAGDRRCAAIVA